VPGGTTSSRMRYRSSVAVYVCLCEENQSSTVSMTSLKDGGSSFAVGGRIAARGSPRGSHKLDHWASSSSLSAESESPEFASGL
jgi:hypothetical protein